MSFQHRTLPRSVYSIRIGKTLSLLIASTVAWQISAFCGFKACTKIQMTCKRESVNIEMSKVKKIAVSRNQVTKHYLDFFFLRHYLHLQISYQEDQELFVFFSCITGKSINIIRKSVSIASSGRTWHDCVCGCNTYSSQNSADATEKWCSWSYTYIQSCYTMCMSSHFKINFFLDLPRHVCHGKYIISIHVPWSPS